MKEQRLTLPKLSKCGTYTEQLLKLGNRVYGHIRRPVGPKVPGTPHELTYWARRTEEQSFRKDQSWAIDRATITLLRSQVVTHIGILVDDGTTYRTPIEHFSEMFMGTVARERDYTKQGGARQWYLPFQYWEKVEPPAAVRAATLAKKMHLPRSRSTAAHAPRP